jgi:hypothetical protein
MKRINVYVSAVLRWSAYKSDAEYQAWIDAAVAANLWGAPGTYTVEVVDGTAEFAEIVAKNEVVTKVYADANYYTTADITDGAVSSVIDTNLATSKLLVSDSSGKIAASTVTSTEAGYLSGVTSGVQAQIDGKEGTVTGAATSILSSDLAADRAVVSNGSGKIAASSATSTEVGYLTGVTSAIQTQIDSKASKTDAALIGEINWASDNTEDPVDISELISFTSTMGLIEGGLITVSSGRTISVSAAVGYASSSENYATQSLKKVSLTSDTLEIPANSNVYVYYTSAGVLSSNVTQPSSRSNILLGRVVTNATDVIYIEKSELDAHHYSNYVEGFFREALGPIFASGGIVTENGTNARQLDINNGVYFFGEHRLTLSSESSLSFNAYYSNGSGGYTVEAAAQTVSNALYDDGSGTLASLSNNHYTKHLLIGIKQQTGTQKFILVYGDSEWNSAEGARAADLPVAPEFAKDTFVRLASIIVQQSVSAIQEIIDERPRVGFSPSAVSAAIVSDHGGLTGLADDDHTQYLLANGSRVMSGSLDMNGNAIVDAFTVNGVTVETHASRHQPGGADAIPTAAAVSIAATNAEGTSTSLARADHTHKIDDAHITDVMLAGSISATKIHDGSVSNTEFGYLDGVTSAIQTQIDGKEPTITGAATSITSSNLTADRVVVSDGTGKVAISTTTSTEAGYLSGVTSAIQTQIDGKEPTITGAATSITGSNLTASRAVVSDGAGKIAASAATSTEVGYLSGVTSGIQSQLNGKEFTITGAATSVTTANLTVDRALISDAGGKIAVSATTSAEIGHVSGVTSGIQAQLNGKEPTITTLPISKGGTNSSTALNNNRVMQSSGGAIVEAAAITANRALVSDANGIPTQSVVTTTELGYVSGVTSAIQTQLDAKLDDSQLAAANGVASLDSNGRLPSAQLTVLRLQAGTVTGASFTGTPRKATITFPTAFANTSYTVVPVGLSDVRTFTIESKTTTTAVINTNANQVVSGNIDWIALPYGTQ